MRALRTQEPLTNPVPEKSRPSPAQRILITVAILCVALGGIWFARASLDTGRVRIASAEDLSAYFTDIGYTAKAIRRGGAMVPRFVVSDIPEDWAEGLTVSQKKSLFFRALLPMLLMVNEEILTERQRLREIRERIARKESVLSADAEWVRDMAGKYGLKSLATGSEPPDARSIATLLRRVDAIPPSLALAQAAVESAYGSSRFAVEGNALYGQWRYGDGLVPDRQRTQLGDYRIADFDSPMDSIRAYARNLNTNPAYRPFRDARAAARQSGETLRGAPLAAGLLAYSEKGQAYINLIRGLIAHNQLSPTDSAVLADSHTLRIVTGAL